MKEYFNEDYWDCECLSNYIHSKEIKMCNICGAVQKEAPDSIASEVIDYKKALIDNIKHMSIEFKTELLKLLADKIKKIEK